VKHGHATNVVVTKYWSFMDKLKAHTILNQSKLGMNFTLMEINEALLATGDLDVFRHTEQPNRTLCTDGFESSNDRPSAAENQRAARLRLETVGRYWVASKDAD
jgi:hypothetical protein